MKYHSALLALPCALVAAVPSPAQQSPLQNFIADQQPQSSRWRLFDNLVDSIDLPPPAHTFARYGEDLVLRFNISAHNEAASLAEAADTLMLDIWEFSQDWVDIRLSKETVPLLLGLLPASLQHSHAPLLQEKALAQAIHDNYPHRTGEQSKTQSPAHLPTRKPFGPDLEPAVTGAETNIFFADYQPLTVIEPWLRLLSSLFTTHVRHINIGLSYEGRNIPGLRVGVHPTNAEDPNPPKRKTIVVVGSLHAREWISTTTVNYIAYSLITGYGKVTGIESLLRTFDFVFIPTLNPDGYVYTWETDRLWRKNRQRTGNRFCNGIDLDRGFGFEWTSSESPCSESYSGDEPFEAVEARAFADWAKNETENNNVDFVGFLDLHSYSQEILYPYSYSCSDTPPGLENLEEVAFGLGKAIRTSSVHGHAYEIMPACEGNVAYTSNKKHQLTPRLEPSGGSALDYFYHEMGVRYAYQLKLRDRGTYGFLLPKENIIPTGKEILNAVLYFGAFLGELYDRDAKEVKLTKPEMEEDEAVNVPPKLDVLDDYEHEGLEDDEDDWVTVKDLDPDDVNWELRRRRRR
ncbi:hypothetical protein M409DRAFT_63436 [Zasmidium cellare ATCC 36951]|uniref:Inactive metallocarboxypeptidase ECM14 n=1 Tax=Zasmidium cellare ATCC 36951 TaxID=1080233 RepID=A0A6A6CXK1_ZASCE|nr:uncharacterized protein M409DRAFT_63436 [Zasmidium cellare ATCC 36951]KAF2171894.1 hypothetical protein M409DRAFT_63436 [Zasmidium cellare ATCC 36951]